MSLVRHRFVSWVLPFILGGLAACNPIYVISAGLHQAQVLLNREPIDQLLAHDDLPKEKREKLQLVLNARSFAEGTMHLSVGRSFTAYSEVDRENLAWVLMASPKTSLTFLTWWYPIVGTVPYKGFYKEAHARCMERRLSFKGYEASVRPTDAVSTLGFFSDPILSTVLDEAAYRVSEVVLHELVHQTIWIPDNVPFNESLANWVALTANPQFYLHESSECVSESCRDIATTRGTHAGRSAALNARLAEAMTELMRALNTLYSSPLSDAEKTTLRDQIFEQQMGAVFRLAPGLRNSIHMNNAEILQFAIYLQGFDLFAALYAQICDLSWSCFFDTLEDIDQARPADQDMFLATRRYVSSSQGS